MRLLFVVAQHTPEGQAGQYVQDLTAHLQQHGYKLRIVTTSLHLGWNALTLQALTQLRNTITEFGPHIISAHGASALALSRIAGAGLRRP